MTLRNSVFQRGFFDYYYYYWFTMGSSSVVYIFHNVSIT